MGYPSTKNKAGTMYVIFPPGKSKSIDSQACDGGHCVLYEADVLIESFGKSILWKDQNSFDNCLPGRWRYRKQDILGYIDQAKKG